MIETCVTPVEARWLLTCLGLTPQAPSPLGEALATLDPLPADSPAAARVSEGLRQRGVVDAAGGTNPFVAAAFEWLAAPERVWSLSVFGPGGAEVIHLAFRSGAAVECRRRRNDVVLRFPLAADEAQAWLERHCEGRHAG